MSVCVECENLTGVGVRSLALYVALLLNLSTKRTAKAEVSLTREVSNSPRNK